MQERMHVIGIETIRAITIVSIDLNVKLVTHKTVSITLVILIVILL